MKTNLNLRYFTAHLSEDYQAKLAVLLERLQPRNRTVLLERMIDDATTRYITRPDARAALTAASVPPKEQEA